MLSCACSFNRKDFTVKKEEISALLEKQRRFYKSGATLPVKFRIEQLEKLYFSVKKNEREICEALRLDLGKASTESYMCEIGTLLSEITYLRGRVKKFAKIKRVKTPFSQFPSKSFTVPTPYGNTLIMSPWNYPILLTLEPLADAIAAGNTAIVKPSAYSPASSNIISKIIDDTFAEEYVAVITGGREENSALLLEKFDLVFFTGSGNVGKEVLRRCAEHLTPAVLELGGKSPCIVDSTADIPLAARRIVFGKYLNCGQTCVAPDYVLCESSVKEQFKSALIEEIKRQFGEAPLENPNYGKIVNQKHFERVLELIDKEKVIFGGVSNAEECRISPTVMDGVTYNDAVMGEEIFGPVLPILAFDNFENVIDELKEKDKPLALYIFSSDKSHINRVISELSYGGGCVNDCIIHLATSNMGFGGVGESGMGSYHGKAGFDTFTHYKSIVDKKTWLDMSMRYQPYTEKNEKTIRKFLK